MTKTQPSQCCFGSTLERKIDFNDAKVIENCNREVKSINTSENKYKINSCLNDHQIFEGLDNSMPFNNEKLSKETYKDIFLGCTRNGTQTTSLKKQLNYINHSKADFDLISKKKHPSTIQKYK